jgi:hypothetical protein
MGKGSSLTSVISTTSKPKEGLSGCGSGPDGGLRYLKVRRPFPISRMYLLLSGGIGALRLNTITNNANMYVPIAYSMIDIYGVYGALLDCLIARRTEESPQN